MGIIGLSGKQAARGEKYRQSRWGHQKARAQTISNPQIIAVGVAKTIVVTAPPVANAGADQTVLATGPQGTMVTLNGSGSTSPTGAPLEFFWSGAFTEGNGLSSEASPTVTLSVGVHEITLVVNDGVIGSAPDMARIEVQDLNAVTCVDKLGAWKNNPQDWPVGELTMGSIIYSQIDLLEILGTPPRGNGVVSLAHQVVPAKLNQARLVSLPADVEALIGSADVLIADRVIPRIGDGVLKSKVTGAITKQLDQFNSGLRLGGPVTCEPQ
ncbi:MAG: PKD domain-containing protein [Deltaproteobacteria bacterium]|nr:PKD domain-containing protein [Deltaproteobacteria bacterium]